MGHGVLKSDMLGAILILENKIITDDLADWCGPLHFGESLIVIHEGRERGSCESFGGRPREEERLRRHGVRVKLRLPVALGHGPSVSTGSDSSSKLQ